METEEKVEYKKTLNLPETTLAMRANATVREIEIQKFWEENNTEYYRPSYRGRSRYHRDRLSAQLYLG